MQGKHVEPLKEPIKATVRLEVLRACGLLDAAKAADEWIGGQRLLMHPSLHSHASIPCCLMLDMLHSGDKLHSGEPTPPHLSLLAAFHTSLVGRLPLLLDTITPCTARAVVTGSLLHRPNRIVC